MSTQNGMDEKRNQLDLLERFIKLLDGGDQSDKLLEGVTIKTFEEHPKVSPELAAARAMLDEGKGDMHGRLRTVFLQEGYGVDAFVDVTCSEGSPRENARKLLGGMIFVLEVCEVPREEAVYSRAYFLPLAEKAWRVVHKPKKRGFAAVLDREVYSNEERAVLEVLRWASPGDDRDPRKQHDDVKTPGADEKRGAEDPLLKALGL